MSQETLTAFDRCSHVDRHAALHLLGGDEQLLALTIVADAQVMQTDLPLGLGSVYRDEGSVRLREGVRVQRANGDAAAQPRPHRGEGAHGQGPSLQRLVHLPLRRRPRRGRDGERP